MARQLKVIGSAILDAMLMILVVFGIIVGVIAILLLRKTKLWPADFHQTRHGIASWYSGNGMVAASRQYPIGSYVRVSSGCMKITVQVTSRGPAWRYFQKGRIIDLSREAFSYLAPLHQGLVVVDVEQWPAPPPSPFDTYRPASSGRR